MNRIDFTHRYNEVIGPYYEILSSLDLMTSWQWADIDEMRRLMDTSVMCNQLYMTDSSKAETVQYSFPLAYDILANIPQIFSIGFKSRDLEVLSILAMFVFVYQSLTTINR